MNTTSLSTRHPRPNRRQQESWCRPADHSYPHHFPAAPIVQNQLPNATKSMIHGFRFREVSVNEIREVLRVWLGVAGLPAPGYRRIAAHCGLDRKTVRRYVEAAQAAGLCRDDDVSAVDDELIGAVAEAVRPVRPHGHGAGHQRGDLLLERHQLFPRRTVVLTVSLCNDHGGGVRHWP